MSAITIFAPITLAEGFTEADLLAASADFQKDFVANHPGILRRELVRKVDGTYLDIVKFRSREDMEDVIEKEQSCEAAAKFFSVMDLTDYNPEEAMETYTSLITYE
ncbi:hypothetical protein [Vibrio sp. 99-70-13A1]|uniref:hypothetical protein n=1 Tax=Vibrio sp. 99-70-13A1 TaxID=2607601 RepID=UPI001493D3B7|nr:hypothetical protein [Vibrio sp. 99-70-13A1]NOH97553.1 hypothetical protein [Vibrio sp. 99-70-13A1]